MDYKSKNWFGVRKFQALADSSRDFLEILEIAPRCWKKLETQLEDPGNFQKMVKKVKEGTPSIF